MNTYAAESTLSSAEGGRALQLESADATTPSGRVVRPDFFAGFATRPDILAAGLLVVADVAATTYYDLSAIRASLDPVTTASGDRLRFESFSRCNGVYARFDLLPEGIESGEVGFGTTNVDINQPLRTALAGVTRSELMHVGVGHSELRVATLNATHVERQVDLPDRWVRGFASVPKIASEMVLAAEASGPAAMRFIATLPSGAPGPVASVVQGPAGLQLAPTRAGGARLAGTARLASLRRLMRFIQQVRVYRHDSGASGWVIDMTGGGQLTLLVSPDPYRGFSGEGALLGDLAVASPVDLDEFLAWQSTIDPAEIAKLSGAAERDVRTSLAVLAVSGRLGFDLENGVWFHRELPLETERVEQDNPRLAAAQKLVKDGHVERRPDAWVVGEAPQQHWVRQRQDRPYCSCRWEARYSGSRGPCSHVLAVQIQLGN